MMWLSSWEAAGGMDHDDGVHGFAFSFASVHTIGWLLKETNLKTPRSTRKNWHGLAKNDWPEFRNLYTAPSFLTHPAWCWVFISSKFTSYKKSAFPPHPCPCLLSVSLSLPPSSPSPSNSYQVSFYGNSIMHFPWFSCTFLPPPINYIFPFFFF